MIEKVYKLTESIIDEFQEKIDQLIEEYQPFDKYKNYELKCYKEGFIAALVGKTEENNPYPLSGHERDTTFMCNFAWQHGNEDGIKYLEGIRKERK